MDTDLTPSAILDAYTRANGSEAVAADILGMRPATLGARRARLARRDPAFREAFAAIPRPTAQDRMRVANRVAVLRALPDVLASATPEQRVSAARAVLTVCSVAEIDAAKRDVGRAVVAALPKPNPFVVAPGDIATAPPGIVPDTWTERKKANTLARELSAALASRGVSGNAAAKAMGLTRSVLQRVLKGGNPDDETRKTIEAWLAEGGAK